MLKIWYCHVVIGLLLESVAGVQKMSKVKTPFKCPGNTDQS